MSLTDAQYDASTSYAEGPNEQVKQQSRIDHMPAMGKVNNTVARGRYDCLCDNIFHHFFCAKDASSALFILTLILTSRVFNVSFKNCPNLRELSCWKSLDEI